MNLSTVLLLIICLNCFLLPVLSQCHNRCNGHGICSKWNTCDCYEGWEGPDCARKSCPTGPAFVDIPHSSSEAHANIECSGQGKCDYKTGLCKCSNGFTGLNCAKMDCFNHCSGHGKCVSLATAASDNDGYNLNRTTTYSLWDADRIHGCSCDFGWTGPDCSQRTCEYGVDPRVSDLNHEVVTFVCACGITCSGRFKLRLFGQELQTWLNASSTTADLLKSIMSSPGIYGNNPYLSFPSVDSNRSLSHRICNPQTTTRTQIRFRRNYGDVAPISVFVNLMKGGKVYFEVNEIQMISTPFLT
jgi:hypothetical protein